MMMAATAKSGAVPAVERTSGTVSLTEFGPGAQPPELREKENSRRSSLSSVV